MAKDVYDFGLFKQTLSELSGEMSTDKELSTFLDVKDQLETISKEHENFLANSLSELDPNGSGIAADFKNANGLYDGLVNSLATAVSYSGVDDNGSVPSTAGAGAGSGGGASGGSYSGGSAGSSSSSSPATHVSGTGTPSSSAKADVSSTAGSTPTIKANASRSGATSSGGTTGTSSSSSSPISLKAGTSAGSALSSAGTVASVGGVVGGLGSAALSSAVSGTGSPSLTSVNYAMGNYAVSDGFSGEFSQSERDYISNLLEENGYSKEDIESIMNGDYSSSKVLVDSVSGELTELAKNNPDVRNQLMEKYGFDVFNDDGSVNSDKLSMALYIDDVNGNGNSMISMLSNQYGVNLVDNNLLNNYSKQLESLVLKDYGIRDTIKEQYGFDVFNSDGTVNSDRLTVAMLIDSKNNDGKTLLSIMNDSVSSDITDYLNTNIKSVKLTPTKKRSALDGATPVAAVLAAGGAAAGIGVVAHNKGKKEVKKEIEIEKDEDIKEEPKDDNWVNKIIEEEK